MWKSGVVRLRANSFCEARSLSAPARRTAAALARAYNHLRTRSEIYLNCNVLLS